MGKYFLILSFISVFLASCDGENTEMTKEAKPKETKINKAAIKAYSDLAVEYAKRENRACVYYNNMHLKTADLIHMLEQEWLPQWDTAGFLVEEMSKLELPYDLKTRLPLLKKYTQKRKGQFELYIAYHKQESDSIMMAIKASNSEVDSLLKLMYPNTQIP